MSKLSPLVELKQKQAKEIAKLASELKAKDVFLRTKAKYDEKAKKAIGVLQNKFDNAIQKTKTSFEAAKYAVTKSHADEIAIAKIALDNALRVHPEEAKN